MNWKNRDPGHKNLRGLVGVEPRTENLGGFDFREIKFGSIERFFLVVRNIYFDHGVITFL